MDYDLLYQLSQDRRFTDIEIIFIDKNNNTISVHTHKCFLMASCDFFFKMFAVGNEQTLNKKTLDVPNAFVSYDVIMSFYGRESNVSNLPECKHSLEMVKCLDYFGLDYSEYLNLEVSGEYFESLLELVEFIGLTNKILELITKNFPENYDITKLSDELIEELINYESSALIVIGDCGGKIKILHAMTGNLVKVIKGHNDYIWNVAFSSDNKLILSCSSDKKIKLFDCDSRKGICLDNVKECYCASLSLDNKWIISGKGNNIKMWDIEKRSTIKYFFGHKGLVRCLSISSDNEYIVSGGGDDQIIVWDIKTGMSVWKFTEHTDCVWCICFSHDGKLVISGSDDKTIKIWDFKNSKESIRTLKGHVDGILCISLLKNNKWLLSGSRDKNINLWNIETGDIIKTFIGHTRDINSISVSSDNKFIVSGDSNGTIIVWNLETNEKIMTYINSKSVFCVSFSYPVEKSRLSERLQQSLS